MSLKRKSEDQESTPKKRAPNFKLEEVKFLVAEVKKRKATLFGVLSPKLTFAMKTQQWMEVKKQLVAAGFPSRNKDQLKKKWEDVSSATKAKYTKRKQTGGGAVDWTEIDETVTEILGKENPSLASIAGGIDTGEHLFSETTLDDAIASDHGPSTSLSIEDGNPVAESQSATRTVSSGKLNRGKKEVLKEERNAAKSLKLDNIREERKVTDIQAMYEEHLKEEHEVKMRMLRKKEQLLDLKLQLLQRKINHDES